MKNKNFLGIKKTYFSSTYAHFNMWMIDKSHFGLLAIEKNANVLFPEVVICKKYEIK